MINIILEIDLMVLIEKRMRLKNTVGLFAPPLLFFLTEPVLMAYIGLIKRACLMSLKEVTRTLE